MAKPNLVYIGSPAFSAEILAHLLESNNCNISAVVTQPDKPLGRKQIITPSPVAQVALKHDLPTYKPVKLDDANLAHLKLLKPDIFLVVSYGKIIPQSWLDVPKIGTFNIHFSLLPKYRGALCISEAIKNGDTTTGVTLMKMDAKLDHGPIISQSEVSIDLDDDVISLNTKLTQAAMQLLDNKLPEIYAGNYTLIAQDEDQATYTPSHRQQNHQTAYVSWEEISKAMTKNGHKIHNLIRSNNPEPGAWTKIGQTEIKILKTSLEEDRLVILLVQMPGKNPISWKQFSQGHLTAK